MRRVSLKMLLLSCAALLLAMDGCSTSTSFDRSTKRVARGVAADEDGEKQAKKGKGPPFRLPADQAGRLLGEALRPTARPGTLRNPSPPPAAAVPWPRLNEPRLDLPGSETVVSRLPQPKRKKQVLPRLVVEEGLGETPDEVVVPQRPSFMVGRRTAIPSQDVSVPPALPVMAQQAPDRVLPDDATAEVSKAAVLAAALPYRTTAAPFVRTRQPEPFANRKPLTMKLPAEEIDPVVDSPAPPKP